ncbi:MAG: 4-(cytidine 5'-diphospho)-2-C-methyl-D-erythritol kinase [Pseudomonadota bacterium]
MIEVFAPAKINLFLHVTAKRDDGYHELESIISFLNIGDVVTLEQAQSYTLSIEGPFAQELEKSTTTEDNIITKAVHAFCEAADIAPSFNVTLKKMLPPASGMGGGSADAAAVIYALKKLSNTDIDDIALSELLVELGADVPVCYKSATTFVKGIGNHLNILAEPETPYFAILMNSRLAVSTKEVFENLQPPYAQELSTVKGPDDPGFMSFITGQHNMLESAASMRAPEIQMTIKVLVKQQGCQLARMTGSGATCFGIFANKQDWEAAFEAIQKEKPSYWVQRALVGKQARF